MIRATLDKQTQILKQNKYIEENNPGEFMPTYRFTKNLDKSF